MCACASIRRASRSVTQLYDSWLRPHGIEAPQFSLLAMLDQLREANQVTLGRRLDLDKTTLSRNLKLLAHKRWVTVGSGADLRERRVKLTPAGRRRVKAARDAWRHAQEQLRCSMSGDEWETMWRTFNALTRASLAAQRGDGRGRTAKRGLPGPPYVQKARLSRAFSPE